jgi:transposase
MHARRYELTDFEWSIIAPLLPSKPLADRGAWANVKPMPGRVNVPVFSPYLYRLRNLVERFFNKLKHFRAIATRFEKHDANYLALVQLAAAPLRRSWPSATGGRPGAGLSLSRRAEG